MGTLVAKRARLHYGYLVLFVCMLVVLGALGLGRFAYTMVLPSMRAGLGLNFTQMGLLASGNFVGYLASALVCGMLAWRYGARRVIGGSLLLAGSGLLLTGFAPSFEFALLTRTLTGVGSAGANVPAMGLASAWFATRRRGLAAGFMVAGSGAGLLLSGQAVPALVQTYGDVGWRVSWYCLGLIVLLLAVVAYAYLRNRPAEKGLLPLGEDVAALPHEQVSQRPTSWQQVLRSRAIWHLAAIYAAYGFAYVIYATFFAAYLEQQGLSARTAGELWGLVGILSLFSGLAWGAFSDWAGRRVGLACVLALQITAFLLFALLQTSAGFVASAVIFGLVAWSVPAIMGAAAGDYVEAPLAPAALGFMTFFFGLGQAIGPGVAGYVGDVATSFAPAFLLAAAVALSGALASLLLRPARDAGGA